MKSIKRKLTLSYIGIIIFTIFICELLVISSIKKYFYDNAGELLSNQIKLSADFYNTYLSSIDLKENVASDVDVFWRNTSAEVQILDTSGNVLMDSIGHLPKDVKKAKDFQHALKNTLSTHVYTLPNSNETIMAVSLPLKKGNNIEGVLRFVTSLGKIDSHIYSISSYLITIGIIVIFISSIISLLLSNKITKPVKEITHGAEKMASGKFNEKITKSSDDEFGKLTDTLNYMAEEILKSEKLKNEFIASVSHELRTPLTSIKGWSVALSLCDPNSKEDFEDGLTIIEKETDRLSALVDDLLDFSKLSSGKITLKKDLVDLKELLKHIQKQLTPRANKDDIELSFVCDNEEYEGTVPQIYADINRLKQLFMNVIDNSLKFTPTQGKIKMNLKFDDNNALISIKDTGCGISKLDLPRVTEKFYKGKNSNSKNGIGLSICSEIVSLHCGSMNILSDETKGTEVIISLPF